MYMGWGYNSVLENLLNMYQALLITSNTHMHTHQNKTSHLELQVQRSIKAVA